MIRRLLFIALPLALSQVSCGDFDLFLPEPGDGAAGSADVDASAEWARVRLSGTCQDLTEADCLGTSGIAINAEGQFFVRAGSADTQRFIADLTPEELIELDRTVDRVKGALATEAFQCQALNVSPGINERISIELVNGQSFLAFDEVGGAVQGQTCFRGGRAAALALEETVRNIVLEYFPEGLPGARDPNPGFPENPVPEDGRPVGPILPPPTGS